MGITRGVGLVGESRLESCNRLGELYTMVVKSQNRVCKSDDGDSEQVSCCVFFKYCLALVEVVERLQV